MIPWCENMELAENFCVYVTRIISGAIFFLTTSITKELLLALGKRYRS